MIGIREYYPKDGEMLPGAKVCLHLTRPSIAADNTSCHQGISLPIDQFNQIMSILPEVETALIARGQTVERPTYDGEQPAPTKAAEDDGAKEDPGSKSRKSEKKNFEATSDEED